MEDKSPRECFGGGNPPSQEWAPVTESLPGAVRQAEETAGQLASLMTVGQLPPLQGLVQGFLQDQNRHPRDHWSERLFQEDKGAAHVTRQNHNLVVQMRLPG